METTEVRTTSFFEKKFEQGYDTCPHNSSISSAEAPVLDISVSSIIGEKCVCGKMDIPRKFNCRQFLRATTDVSVILSVEQSNQSGAKSLGCC